MGTNIVGDNIRRVRKSLNLTQEELALRCDLTQGYINFLENGKRGYTKKSLAKIANALNIHISQLFRDKGVQNYFAEPLTTYGKRSHIYYEIIALLDKLPDNVVERYKVLLKAEIGIQSIKKINGS